ncbi:MFS transporter [Actibacterium mucosum KCTC 23349]|uniref:MFS transporter n=1 Tax=Actibacterium mucosum KCTC 23349 TaxID=1454373 RepID=A0A037ZIS9_9RHOB|nr:MFS transporter [Actibacterium mucosum]KAJ55539.1 MFS transporter [Actibacterium mucosum KCTC 23349]
MPSAEKTARLQFLALLFVETVSAAMIVPFMGFFLIEGLGHQPWILSVYSVMAVGLTLTANRLFARRIDGGTRVFPLIGLAATGFALAAAALFAVPKLWMVLSVGVLGFGISSTAISTMFSLGGSMAERHNMDRGTFNSHMRATTSTGWMVGPAAAFLVADLISVRAVFGFALCMSLIWIVMWWFTLPRDVTAEPKPKADAVGATSVSGSMRMAAAFVFCMSLAHSLTFASLPVFYVAEVGLPGYAPGLAFSVKTFVEVFAIFSVPMIVARIGMRRALLGTTALAVVTILVLSQVQTFPQMVAGAAMEGLYYGLYASLGISYVQSFGKDRPAGATALYWNTLMVSGLLAGPVAGAMAQFYDFQTVIMLASGVALLALGVLAITRQRAPAAA